MVSLAACYARARCDQLTHVQNDRYGDDTVRVGVQNTATCTVTSPVLYKSSSRTGGATQKRTGKRTREPHQFKREDRVAAGGVTFRRPTPTCSPCLIRRSAPDARATDHARVRSRAAVLPGSMLACLSSPPRI